MIAWYSNLLESAHRKTERLLDAQHEGSLGAADSAWLHDHLQGCERCRQMQQARAKLFAAYRALPALEAPAGFAAKVLRASRQPVPAKSYWAQWALGGMTVAISAAAVLAVVTTQGRNEHPGVEVSGASAGAQAATDFVVRAPGAGAAEVRAIVAEVIQAHNARLITEAKGFRVVVPRAELLGFLQDLSKQGAFKVSKVREGELENDPVWFSFELD